MSIPGEEPTDIHPQPPKARRGKLGGATRPWGWSRNRGLGSGRHRDPVVNYTLEWTPIPGDHPSQPAARVAAERRTTMSIYDEIQAERERQDGKWGEQNHPSGDPVLMGREGGVGPMRLCMEYEIPSEPRAKYLCQTAAGKGETSWPLIASEEFSEACSAFADGTEVAGREELVQLAAVVVQWIECIDRRAKGPAVVGESVEDIHEELL